MDIKINNLTVKYDEKLVLNNLTLNIKENKITCILGESGIGKTTLLNSIANTINYSGNITNQGKVSFIFQDNRLIPNISVYKNLELVLKNIVKDKLLRKQKIENILKIVELIDIKDKFPKELSGGMLSRISMARGFVYPSDTLLMDEAFKGLDPALKTRLIHAFYRLYQTNNRTVVFVTHSIDEALLLADEIVVLKGHPADIYYKTKINIHQEERKLTDENLDNIRKELLIALID